MTLYLDVEILDWFQDENIAKLEKWRQHAALRFGLATTYVDEFEAGFATWMPNDLGALWRLLMISAGPIVTWNGDEFDIPYLLVHGTIGGFTSNDPWADLPRSLDLMTLIRRESKRIDGKERWYKLDVIAQANLGRGKIAHGDEAAEWLRSGDPDLIQKAAEYCKDDVQLVRELHQLLLNGTGLICPARPDRREYKELHIWLNERNVHAE